VGKENDREREEASKRAMGSKEKKVKGAGRRRLHCQSSVDSWSLCS
jgi:hypothetical protein